MTINEVLAAYTSGAMTLEEANNTLADMGTGFHLDPARNDLTPAEIMETVVTETNVSGYGLLDTGTGTMDKVHVLDSELCDVDLGEMYALCYIGGSVFHVHGRILK